MDNKCRQDKSGLHIIKSILVLLLFVSFGSCKIVCLFNTIRHILKPQLRFRVFYHDFIVYPIFKIRKQGHNFQLKLFYTIPFIYYYYYIPFIDPYLYLTGFAMQHFYNKALSLPRCF
jgi:hypothetical protein